MHDDEYREEQKQETLKLMCLLTLFVLMLVFWGLALKGFVCVAYH